MTYPIRGTAVYADAYDYADTNAQSVTYDPPESADLGDSGGLYPDEDAYTDIFSEEVDYYESGEALPAASGAEPVEDFNADELPVAGEDKALVEQFAKLAEQIKESPLPAALKDDLAAQVERAKAAWELNPGQPEVAEEAYLQIQESFEEYGRHAPAALEMAANFGKEVGDVEAAAQDAGLNLASLPKPPNESVMRFLNALGIPGDAKVDQYRILKDQRTQNMKALKQSLEAQSQIPDGDGKPPIDANDLEMSEQYRNLLDPEYQQMKGVVQEIRQPVMDGLKAMGYQATAGESADQIMVEGGTVDFFDENTAGLTLGSQATALTQNENDFFTMPEEVDTDAPVWLDATGRVVGGVLGATAGSIIGGTVMPLGGALVGAGVGAYLGEELGHQIVQGLHDFFN